MQDIVNSVLGSIESRWKKGAVTPKGGTADPVEVEYWLEVTGRDDASGRIRIPDDPQPSDQFMGDPKMAYGAKSYFLTTASSCQVEICFEGSDGRFVCKDAAEARECLQKDSA